MNATYLSVSSLVDGMQATLEAEGYELYCKPPRDNVTFLVMFHSERRRFIFFVFDNNCVGAYERVDCFVDVAEIKAEKFRELRSKREDGGIRSTDT